MVTPVSIRNVEIRETLPLKCRIGNTTTTCQFLRANALKSHVKFTHAASLWPSQIKSQERRESSKKKTRHIRDRNTNLFLEGWTTFLPSN